MVFRHSQRRIWARCPAFPEPASQPGARVVGGELAIPSACLRAVCGTEPWSGVLREAIGEIHAREVTGWGREAGTQTQACTLPQLSIRLEWSPVLCQAHSHHRGGRAPSCSCLPPVQGRRPTAVSARVAHPGAVGTQEGHFLRALRDV